MFEFYSINFINGFTFLSSEISKISKSYEKAKIKSNLFHDNNLAAEVF